MSILVDHEIKSQIAAGRLIIDPFDDTLIQPNSIDVRLSDVFTYWPRGEVSSVIDSENIRDVIDPYDKNTIVDGQRTVKSEIAVVAPKAFILGATMEKFQLPDDIVGQLTGKSSLARLGIMVHVTAGYIDAGFSEPPATVTLEIVNVANRPVKLYAGMPIAQMVFTKTAPCAVPYNKRESAKYNGQCEAASSKYYLNKATS